MKPFSATHLRLRRWSLALAAPMLLATSQSAHASAQGDWATASDIAVGGLALWSLGVPAAEGDTQGAFRAGGSAEGIPALALASFVGLARVEADKHH